MTSPRSTKISPIGRFADARQAVVQSPRIRPSSSEIALLRLRLALLGVALALVLGPLLGERAREVEPLDAELLDEDLAQPIAGRTLLRERKLQLLLGDEAFLDEDGADQPGRNGRRIHGRSIGNPSFEL